MHILVTGGAGFIGSNFIRYILNKYPDYEVINLDKLTYSGNLANLEDVAGDKRYSFIRGDICDEKVAGDLTARVDWVINFAAESHVDRSINDASEFMRTNFLGVRVLLDACRSNKVKLFMQVSTDEVYGSTKQGKFTETSLLRPSSPYSASKAAADLLALSYFTTYRLPVIITRSSNNFGPYQYPEKFIPLFITNLLENKKVPLYSKGENIRNWLFVEDNCQAIDLVLHKGEPGEVYNIGSDDELDNLSVAKMLVKKLEMNEEMISYVTDRPGHDFRYSLDSSRIKKLGWNPEHNFVVNLDKTIDWYKSNRSWWQSIRDGSFQEYYQEQYGTIG